MGKKRAHVKPEQGEDEDIKKKKAKDDNWEPENWKEVYENIRKMRKDRSAACDMGKDKTSKYTEKERRFHVLISLMLSSQTKDEINHAAVERLKEHGLTVDNILKTSDEKLGKLIYPVGFWRTKVKYIKGACLVLKNEYDGDIPRSVEDLCKIKGVGPKMAYLCMCSAWNECVGIGVDTHVHRIAARLGWTEKECKTPEATRKALESWLPKQRWKEVNRLLVGFGQQICLPIGPKCGECLNRELCPVGQKWKPSLKKKTPSPKKEVVSPKKEVVSPKKEVVSPKKEVLSPKKEVVSPKKEVVSPKKEVITPKKEVVQVLKDNYDCDIPRSVKDLCKLKGVGPKMAHICMSSAWGEPSGIGVDTHVHRISGRLGWTQKECKTPEATRMALESWLPRDLWVEINWMLVGFGQEICRPVGPRCGECLNKDICPVGQKWVPSPKKKVSPKKKAT